MEIIYNIISEKKHLFTILLLYLYKYHFYLTLLLHVFPHFVRNSINCISSILLVQQGEYRICTCPGVAVLILGQGWICPDFFSIMIIDLGHWLKLSFISHRWLKAIRLVVTCAEIGSLLVTCPGNPLVIAKESRFYVDQPRDTDKVLKSIPQINKHLGRQKEKRWEEISAFSIINEFSVSHSHLSIAQKQEKGEKTHFCNDFPKHHAT